MNGSPIENVLSQLDKVRETGKSRWIACCPAHDDKNPSLSIAECDDGRVLLNCFPGCDTGSVVDALGLKWRDLFPEDNADRVRACEHPKVNYRATLKEIQHPLWVVLLAANDVVDGKALTKTDLDSVCDAKRSIENALEVGRVA